MEKPDKTVVMIGTGAGNARALGALTGDNMPVTIADPVTVAPDLIGRHGRAWKVDLVEARRIANVAPEDDAALVHWVIEAPWAHPCWHSYSLVLVHLRPTPGQIGTIHFYLPCASHEMWLFAIDPNKDRRDLVTTGYIRGHWLQPKNFAAQFTEESDADALARIAAAVRDVCDGELSPDTDCQRHWVRRFGDNMVRREFR